MYIQVFVTLITICSWLTVLAMSAINPSQTLAIQEAGWFIWLTSALLIPAGISLLFNQTFRHNRATSFFYWYGTAFLSVFAAVFWAAHRLHRDFYSLLFLYAIIFFILIMVRLPYLRIIKNRKQVYPAIQTAAWGIFYVFSLWLILMGYAIITRTEPRWIESIAYNFLAVIILGILVGSIAILREHIHRVFLLSGDEILLEDRSLGDYFTGKEKEILESFARSPEHQLTCAELLAGQMFDCQKCIEEGWTATNCKAYRNLKNQIILVKKYLELLEIGTLVAVSDNYRDNKIKGWKLRFFDDVILRINL